MTNRECERLAALRLEAELNMLLSEKKVLELRDLEHKAAVEFAKKMGCKLTTWKYISSG